MAILPLACASNAGTTTPQAAPHTSPHDQGRPLIRGKLRIPASKVGHEVYVMVNYTMAGLHDFIRVGLGRLRPSSMETSFACASLKVQKACQAFAYCQPTLMMLTESTRCHGWADLADFARTREHADVTLVCEPLDDGGAAWRDAKELTRPQAVSGACWLGP